MKKRKKYKFALFHNSPLCFEFDDWQISSTTHVIELGAGTALFLVALADKHRDKNFVAIDVKADRLQKGAQLAEAKGLTNIHFVRARADQLDLLFTARSLESIWLTFADPFPRERSARRRMTHGIYLEKYAAALKRGGKLFIKHDNSDFFCWSLEEIVKHKWIVKELSFDLHDSDLDDDYKIQTTYEIRWLKDGLKTHFVSAQAPEAS